MASRKNCKFPSNYRAKRQSRLGATDHGAKAVTIAREAPHGARKHSPIGEGGPKLNCERTRSTTCRDTQPPPRLRSGLRQACRKWCRGGSPGRGSGSGRIGSLSAPSTPRREASQAVTAAPS